MNLDAHLNELSPSEANALRHVVARLRAAPERLPSADLADRVLAAAGREARKPRSLRPSGAPAPWWGAAAAAVAAGLIGAITLFPPPRPHRSGEPAAGAGAADGIRWLASRQEPDGTWSPAKHGGSEAYRPALTALAALALAREPAHKCAPQLLRACQALAALQEEDGAFGGTGRSRLYNHAITACALATLYPEQPSLKAPLERAVAFIRSQQTPEGGWDYEAGSEGNAALTAWQVRALACAAGQGFDGAGMPLRKGLRWLRKATRDDGSVAYHPGSATRSESLSALAAYALITAGRDFPGLPALGQHVAGSLHADPGATAVADCYRDYAKVMAFVAAGATPEADAVRHRMKADRQAEQSDQWQQVGGALYTTALYVLASK